MANLICVRVCKGNSNISLREKVLQLSECVGEQVVKALALANLYVDIETDTGIKDSVFVTIKIEGGWFKRMYTKWLVVKGIKRFTTAYPDSYIVWSV